MAVINGPARWTLGLHPYARGIVGTVCFFIGFGISIVMNGVIDAANKAVFILFLENPHALEHTHPEHHLPSSSQCHPCGWRSLAQVGGHSTAGV